MSYSSTMYEWKECSLNVYQKAGQKFCTVDNIHQMDEYMKRSIIDPFNIIFQCNDMDLKQCSKLMSHMPKSQRQAKRNKYKTPVPSIMFISHYL